MRGARGSGAVAGGPGLVLSEGQRGCTRAPGLTLAVGLLEAGVCSEMGVCSHRLGCAERTSQRLCVTPDLPSRSRASIAGSSLHEVITLCRVFVFLPPSLPRAGLCVPFSRTGTGAGPEFPAIPVVAMLSWSCCGVWSGFLTICFRRGKI